jgi:hypothetical protein
MEKEWKDSLMGIPTRETMKMVSLQGLESIIGRQGASSRGSSRPACDADRDYGKKGREEAINMRGTGRQIKKMDMVCLHGLMEQSTKGSLLTILKRAMENCSTLMEQ